MSNMTTDDDTRSAESSDSPETTVIESETAAAPDLAWSLEDEPDEPQRQPWRTTWGLVTLILACSVVAALGVGVVVWWVHLDDGQPSATSTPTTGGHWQSVGDPTTTATAAAPTTSAPTREERDARFTALVAPKFPPKYRDRLPEAAQRTCMEISVGRSQAEEIDRVLGNDSDGLTWDGVNFFVTTAVQTYCPQYANR